MAVPAVMIDVAAPQSLPIDAAFDRLVSDDVDAALRRLKANMGVGQPHRDEERSIEEIVQEIVALQDKNKRKTP